jgi:hypothetical protein
MAVLFLYEQIDEVDAGGFGFGSFGWLGRGQLAIDDRIHQARRAFGFTLEIDLHHGGVERVETRFDGLAGQVRGRFVEAILQQEGTVAAHHTIQAMEEEAAEVCGRRQLADVFDIALPAQQRRGSQRAVFGAVVDVEPRPQALVQLLQRERLLAVQVVQELFPARAEEALDFSASLRLIRRGVHDEHAHRCRDSR